MHGYDRNITSYTLISVISDAQSIMSGHDRNKNQCNLYNDILGQVNLFHTGLQRIASTTLKLSESKEARSRSRR